MARAPRTAAKKTNKTVQPGRRHRYVRVYTAWHPVLVALLEQVLPVGFYQCISEFQLSREPLRVASAVHCDPWDVDRPRRYPGALR